MTRNLWKNAAGSSMVSADAVGWAAWLPMIPRLLALPLLFAAATAGRGEEVRFNRDIRPILSDACFECHGPDEQARRGGLRLDLAETAFLPGKSGLAALTPGQPGESELLARILQEPGDPDLMPPPESGKALSAAQRDTLRRWIEQGARYESHWAFATPARPAVPERADAPHPADAFLLQRLEAEGLAMQPEADKATLLRRVSLDLTGLPPSLEEQEAFLRDDAPGAYERAVDGLLASPHYGERMALEWLDLARYADSNGFQSDGSRQMWLWRDWLIGAFNRNLPFDRFTIEQIAGDLLPGAGQDQIIATGFNRNHRLNGEGGRIVEEWFVETVIDRLETTGTTWMALTLNCARCHDHKYDPISQKEFYQLFAFFNSIEESGVLGPEREHQGNTQPLIRVPDEAQQAELEALDRALAAAEAGMKAAEGEMAAAFARWEEEKREALAQEGGVSRWTLWDGVTVRSLGGAALARQADGSWLASGPNPANDTYEIDGPLPDGRFGGLLLEVFPDASLPGQSLGRGANGNFVLTGVELHLSQPGEAPPAGAPVPLSRAEADYEQSGYGVSAILENAASPEAKGVRGWAVDGNGPDKRLPRRAMFLPAAAAEAPPGSLLRLRLRHQSQFGDHQIGRFRLSLFPGDPGEASLDGGAGMPEAISRLLAKPAAERAPEKSQALEAYFRETADHPLRLALSARDAAKARRDEHEKSIPTVMVMKEKPEPREAHVLVRGEYDRPAEPVGRGLPAALPPLPEGAPLDRLGLARWLVSGEHPLTARVWVNRAWERLFGTGIVKTSEDFGSQAEWPVHPELLDWLAAEFASPSWNPPGGGNSAAAWDMKALLKLIVTSRAYRQSSAASPELHARDPENRLLARGPRFRLSGELIRDQALAASGLLSPRLGGPSVRPFMPAGVWDETSVYGDLRGYRADEGEGRYRRSLYTIWKRTGAPPSLLLFDAPSREICAPRRSRTNTPLQALALLNETTYVEAARALAERMMREAGPGPAERLALGYRLASARPPDETALATLREGWESRLAHYRAAPEAAAAMTGGGSAPDAGLDPAELAAYTVSASVLLNLDRVITRD